MATDWQEVSLADAYEISSGLSKPRADFGFGFPFLSFKDVFENYFVPAELKQLVNSSEQERTTCSIRRGDVFLTRTSETLDELGMSSVALADVLDATFNGFTKRLRPKTDTRIHPEYAGYYFRSDRFRKQIYALSNLSTRASLNNEMIGRLTIILPPLEEQKAIAAILKPFDDKIELNRRMSETLEAMARALFKSWFVDFDPVRAKAEGRDLGLAPQLTALFPERFIETEDGKIPEGWKRGTLAHVADLDPEVWTQHTRPVLINYLDLSSTKWGRIEAITRYYRDEAPSRAQRVLRPNDTIVGTVRPGNGSFAFITNEGLTGSTGFAVLRPRRADAAEFVYLAATSQENIETLAHLADGAAYPAVRPEAVAATPVVLPQDDVFSAFSKHTRPIFKRIAKNAEMSATLAALRDALLPMLISGEIRVKDAERLISQAT